MICQTILEMFKQRSYTDIQEEKNKITALKPDGNKICAFTSIIPKLKVKEILDQAIRASRRTIAPSPEEKGACLVIDYFEL